MSLLVKGFRVVISADDHVADVYIAGNKVTTIGASLDLPADKVVDASGRCALPGVSIRTPTWPLPSGQHDAHRRRFLVRWVPNLGFGR